MLLFYGIEKLTGSWHVLETKAPMFARVYYIMGGTTRYTDSHFTHTLKKDWLYIFPSHAPYEMTTDPDDPLECMYLHLDIHTADLSRLIAVPVEAEPELRHLLALMCDAIAAAYPPSYLELLAQSFEALCLIKQLFQSVDADTGRYIKALRETYTTNIPLDDISASLGYSTEYFIRIFQKKLGVSPHQYVISLRMSDAVRMLIKGKTLDEIAESIGYSDGHSFSNAFRRYYGISPSEYRKNYAGYV